jgi:hypothetical protein
MRKNSGLAGSGQLSDVTGRDREIGEERRNRVRPLSGGIGKAARHTLKRKDGKIGELRARLRERNSFSNYLRGYLNGCRR